MALALQSCSPETSVTVWGRRADQFEEILSRGLADNVTTDPAVAATDADLVILCTPVEAMADLAATIAPHLKPGALVTDAGSVKACVVGQLHPLLGDRFVGAHPMAGSERSGLAAARADLFKGAACILTPMETTPVTTVEKVRAFWVSLGSRVSTMSPEAHDRLVARLSHLPHAMAFALVNLVAASLPPGSSSLAGGSYRDITRVAASDPSLWTGIFTLNRDEVVESIHEMAELLRSLAQEIKEGKSDLILDFITRAKEHRDLPPQPDELP
jgi:prephenate dehydrogenase